jgi:uncharacterized protein (TIGR02246 family)
MSDQATADELAIKRLNADYCDAILRRDAQAWGATWADDATWVLMGEPTQGRDNIVAQWLATMEGFPVVFHQVTNEQIDIAGDTATQRVYLNEELITADQQALRFVGVYNDECIRTPQGWRYASRSFGVLYQGPGALIADGWMGYPA